MWRSRAGGGARVTVAGPPRVIEGLPGRLGGGHAATSVSVCLLVGTAGEGQEDLVERGQVQGELGARAIPALADAPDGLGSKRVAGPPGTVSRAARTPPGREPVSSAEDRGRRQQPRPGRRGARLGSVPRRPASARRGVSWAMTRPWSMTVISSASASASSRYCVVSSTVEPSVTSGARPPTCRRAWPGRGRWSARRGRSRRPTDQARGEVEPAAHAAGVGLGAALGGVARGRTSRAARRPAPGRRGGRSSSWPISTRFCVPVRSSSTEAYWPVSPIGCADLAGVRDTSRPATRARAAVGPQQGGEDPDGGRLAGGAVGAQHAEHRALAGARSTPSSA